MCRTVETTAAANRNNVPALRRWVTHHVADTYNDAELSADAAVVAAELISNAVRAGSRDVTVHVDLHVDEVRVAVTDDAAGTPRTATPDADSTSGRGLPIIEAVAKSWGVMESRGVTHGKSVWAILLVARPVPGSLECNHPQRR